MLIEEQIQIRKKRALDENFTIRKKGKERIFTDYSVTSASSGKTYRIAIGSLGIGGNYCSCPDFASNTLGTCKHVETVIDHIQKNVPKKHSVKNVLKKAEIYLKYGQNLDVKIKLPADGSDELQRIKREYFDSNDILPKERFSTFRRLMSEVEKLDDNVIIYSDAIEYVERELERQHDLKEEQHMLKKQDEGTLVLNLVKAKLYPYQQRGVLFAAFRGRTIIGDDMGLGKTVQAIAASQLLAKKKGITKVLIVSPASLKYQWQQEIRKFTGKESLVLEGLRNKRIGLYGTDDFYKITNYEAVIRDVDLIMQWQPDLIILDEAQRIKNWETKTAKAVKSLKSKYAIVLTGTPMENKLSELYSIVQFIDNRQLGPSFRFFHDHIQFDETGKLLGYKDLDKVREKMKPILIRRHKREVLKQLPPKTENVYYVKMSSKQAVPYDEQASVVAQIITKWKKQKWLSDIDRRRLLCCMTNMRMLCDSTYLFDKTTNFSPKLEEFEQLIKEMCIENKNKVVVFSQWTRMLIKAAEVLDNIGVTYVLFHGEVPVKKRGQLIQEFMENPECKVFFSTDAGGLGLNLQAADTVINLDIPWNPAVIAQRVGRVHRLGQYNPVTVINLVTKDSIEERVLATIRLKQKLFSGLFDGNATEVDFSALKKQSFINIISDMMEDEIKKREEKTSKEESPADKFVSAGIDFLTALANNIEKQGKMQNNDNSVTGQSNGIEALTKGISKMIKKDAETEKLVLQIPMPSEAAVKRGIDALGRILRSIR